MKISYIISHGVAEWVEADTVTDNVLTIKLKPSCDGSLVIGSTVYPVKHGEVFIPIGALRDGEHRPRLEYSDGVVTLSPFVKKGRSVSPKECDAEVIRRLVKVCYELEIRLKSAESTIAQLNEMCTGHNIFDFERNET